MIAVFAPLITKLVGVDPLSFNSKVIDDSGGLPKGRWGGISLAHPLGVEPGTGRDLFARLLYGSRISLLIAFSGTFITLVLGVVVGIIAGYSRGWLDTALGRLMDLILAFPLLLILLAMSSVLTQRLETTFHLAPNVARVTYIILVLSLFGWPYLARIMRGQVLSLREREFVESAVSMGAGTPADPVQARSCPTSGRRSSSTPPSCCRRSSRPRRRCPSWVSACCRPRRPGARCSPSPCATSP